MASRQEGPVLGTREAMGALFLLSLPKLQPSQLSPRRLCLSGEDSFPPVRAMPYSWL